MEYFIKMSDGGYGNGDVVCFLSACRTFVKTTGHITYVDIHPDVVEAYKDDKLRFGSFGVRFVIHPSYHHRDRHPGQCHNYLGTFLASMGLLRDECPALDLPVFETFKEKRALIQPFSGFAKNPPLEYIQKMVDTFSEQTGMQLYAIGAENTPHNLKNVDYSLLKNGIAEVMRLVQDASFVLSPRSLSAHLAAGYHVPSFVWCPDDGENWHLNYPNWINKRVRFQKGTEYSEKCLVDFLRSSTTGSTSNTSISDLDVSDPEDGSYQIVRNKICVVTAYTNDMADIGDFTSAINRKYCNRHNYDFKVFREGFDQSRSPRWSKLKFIKQTLKDYEWVFWIDADAIFTNHDMLISGFVQDRGDLFMCLDLQQRFNAGVMLLRNCDWTFWMLDEAWSRLDMSNEQDAINLMYSGGVIGSHLIYYMARAFNGLVGIDDSSLKGALSNTYKWQRWDFVAHCTGNHSDKLSKLKDVASRCELA